MNPEQLTKDELEFFGSEIPEKTPTDLLRGEVIDLGEEPIFTFELQTPWETFGLKIEVRTQEALKLFLAWSLGKTLLVLLTQFFF